MDKVGKYAYCQIDVDEHGRLKPGQDPVAFLKDYTDVIIMAHGYRTEGPKQAHDFYNKFFVSASSEVVTTALGSRLNSRKIAVLGVAWPSGEKWEANFWKMKARAGLVGKGAVNEVSHTLMKELPDLKIHLIGHSLGARVMILAAVWPAPGFAQKTFASMTLIEPAVSKHVFANNFDNGRVGYYRVLVETRARIIGPILVVYSDKDKVLSVLYKAAMKLTPDGGIGDKPTDFIPANGDPAHKGDAGNWIEPFADLSDALGSTGCAETPEAYMGLLMRGVGEAYDDLYPKFALINVNASKYIPGHSEINDPAVAYALLYAVTSV